MARRDLRTAQCGAQVRPSPGRSQVGLTPRQISPGSINEWERAPTTPLPPTGKGCSRGGVRLEDDCRWGGPSFLSGIAIVLISRAELIEETIQLQVSRPLPSALGLKLSNHPCSWQFLACENGIRVDQVQPHMRPQSSTEPLLKCQPTRTSQPPLYPMDPTPFIRLCSTQTFILVPYSPRANRCSST